MNYRHAYHAGNFADVLKHVLLSRILVYLTRKPAPVRFIDTHAGIGRYDLGSAEAERTGEWRDGIGRLDRDGMTSAEQLLFAPYLEAVGSREPDGRPLTYPGSPALAQRLLRAADRLLLCEMHPTDAVQLRASVRGDARVTVLAQDGYRGLKGAVPPPERRGVVLIDPPFEEREEFASMVTGFDDAYRRWPTGIYALWYPIKDDLPVHAFLHRLREKAAPRLLEAEVFREEDERSGLRGSGLVVVNPPYVLKDEARQILPVLAHCFGREQVAWSWRVDERSA